MRARYEWTARWKPLQPQRRWRFVSCESWPWSASVATPEAASAALDRGAWSARADQAPLSKAADAASGVATEALHGQLSQLTKRHLLCGCSGFQRAVHSYLARKGQVAKPCA